MKRSLCVIVALLAVFTAVSWATSPAVTLTASYINVGGGTPLVNGMLCVTPVDAANHPLPASRRGGSWGGALTSEASCASITNGVLASGFQVADTALTTPTNICLRITITDANQNNRQVYMAPCVQPASTGQSSWCSTSGGSTTCNFDNYQPNLAPLALVQVGPQGDTGAPGPNCAADSPPGTCVLSNVQASLIAVDALVSSKVSPIPYHSALVFAGDSICSNAVGLRWTDLLMSMSQFVGRIDANHNTCVSGRTIEQVASAYTAEVYPLRPSVTGISPTFLFVEAGSNSLQDSGDTPAAAYAAIAAYWAQAQSDGFTVIAMTVLPRGSSSLGSYTSDKIETYNSLVRAALAPGADYAAAPPSSPLYSYLWDINKYFSDPYDPIIFSTENGMYVHPTYAGQRMIAQDVNHFFGGDDVPVAVFTGRRGIYSFTCDTSGLSPANNTGQFNTSCGVNVLDNNTSGSYNASFGAAALSANTSGSNNTATGAQAAWQVTTGSNLAAFGMQALYSEISGSNSTAFGYKALFYDTVGGNTAVGEESLYLDTTGTNNTAVGVLSGYGNTTGSDNTSIGNQAQQGNQTGADNTAVGNLALYANTSSSANTAVGSGALKASTGAASVGVGYEAAYKATSAAHNVAIGQLALAGTTTGGNNVAVGNQAGEYQANGSTDLVPNNSIYIGAGAKGNSNSDSNSIVIGYNAIGLGANTTVIGTPSTTETLIYGIEAYPSQTAIASATTITPTARFFHITGTTAINTITAPAACTGTGTMCQITVIPDGIWTTTVSGNIALASTAVVGKALLFTYDSSTGKWYPSY